VSRFKRLRGGRLQATLDLTEVDLLRALPDELRTLYRADDASDPVHERLFPRAYLDPTQEQAEDEWQQMVHPELLRERLEALDLVVGSLGRGDQHRDRLRVELSEDESQAWLGVLNDTRLALGTRLGVTEDTDYTHLDPADPSAASYAMYIWLTEVQGDLVETLLG
jgi:phytoene dehydrogenase-like protein